jgi:hypothetical protein
MLRLLLADPRDRDVISRSAKLSQHLHPIEVDVHPAEAHVQVIQVTGLPAWATQGTRRPSMIEEVCAG